MNRENGGLNFTSRIRTEELQKDAEKVKMQFKSLGQSVESEGMKFENAFKNIGKAAVGIFTIQQAANYVSKIAQVRGEFQQLEVAFSTMLKSKEKADKLMGEAVKLAAITPFTLQDVATGAKQLLAYGFEAENISKNLTMLGNVASGVSTPLGDLVYLYGTLQTQGRAYTRDIMQFTSRGIPMIDELAKVLGVGKEQVQGLVEAGKVGFPEVEKAMQNMTKEGGMFFKLMEEQSKTITGKISNLSDAFSRMFNDIGKSNEGIISGALDSTIDLINNYEEVGKSIAELIVAFGVYKAVMITVATLQTAVNASAAASVYLRMARDLGTVTIGHKLNAAAIAVEDAATKALNKSMLINPYVLIAASVAALSYGIYKLATHTTEAEDALKKLDDATNDYNAALLTEQVQVETLFAKLNNAKKGTQAYDQAKQAIMSKYGQYLKGLGEETHALDNVALAYKSITVEATKAAKARAMQTFSDLAAKDYGEKMKPLIDDFKEVVEKKYGKKNAAKIIVELTPVITGDKSAKLFKPVIDLFNGMGDMANKYGPEKMGDLYNPILGIIKKSQEASNIYKSSISSATEIFGEFSPEKMQSKTETVKSFANQLKEVEETLKSLKQKQNDLKTHSIQSNDYAADIEANKKAIAEAEATLNTLLNKSTTKETKQADIEAQNRLKAFEDILKNDIDFQQKQKDLEFNYRQERINLITDFDQKEREQNQLDYEKKMEALKRQSEGELELLKENAQKAFEAQGGKGQADVSKIELPKQSKDLYANLGEVYKEELDRKNDKLLQDRLDKYKDYSAKKLDIDKQYNNDFQELINTNADGKNDSAIAQLSKDWENALTDLQNTLLKDMNLLDIYTSSGSDLITKKIKDALPLFTDLSHATLSELQQVKSVISGIELSPDLQAQLKEAGIDVAKLTELLEKAKKASIEATDERTWKILDDSIGKVVSSLGKLGQTLSQSSGKLGQLGQVINTLAGSYQSLSENIKLANKESLTSEDTATMAANAIDAITDIYSMIANQVAENKQAQEDWNAKIEEGVHQARLLRIEQDAYKEANVFGVENPYARAIAGAKQYGDSMAALQAMTAKMEGGQLQTGNEKKVSGSNVVTGAVAGAVIGSVIPGVGTVIGAVVGGLIGLFTKKTVPVFESLKQKYGEIYNKDTFEINPAILADYDKLDESTKQMIDDWEEVKDKAKAAQDEMRQNFRDLAGDIGTNLSDALVDAFKNGNVYGAMNDFHKYMTGIIENIIAQMIFAQTMQPFFDELDKRMNESMQEGGDGSITDDLVWFYSAVQGGLANYERGMNQARAGSKGSGFELFTGESGSKQTGSTGAFQSMSQDTGNALEGRFTTIQMLNVEMNNSLKAIAPDTRTISINSVIIAEKLIESRDIAMQSMWFLEDIRKNTNELYSTNELLQRIAKHTDNL